MRKITLAKTGCFMTAVEKDAEIIAKELGYNVTCAFPMTVPDKNIEKLRARGIECRCKGLTKQRRKKMETRNRGHPV